MTSDSSAKPVRGLLSQIAIATVLVSPAIAHFEGYIQFQTSILVYLFIITAILANIAEELTQHDAR